MKNKKRTRRILILAVAYLVLVFAVIARDKILHIDAVRPMNQDMQPVAIGKTFREKQEEVKQKNAEQQKKYEELVANISYDLNQAEQRIYPKDCESVIAANNLPSLERMNQEDADKYMSEIQVLKKMEALHIDSKKYETPVFNWKNLYNQVAYDVKKDNVYTANVTFNGNTASQLNELIRETDNAYITIASKELVLDETIVMKSNIAIDAKDVIIRAGSSEIDKAMIAEDCSNIAFYNIDLSSGGYKYGIYIIRTNNFVIEGCNIAKSVYKGLVVMGTCSEFRLTGNDVYENGNGAVFLNGNISNGIIKDNTIRQNQGTRNLTAGLVMTSMEIDDYYTAYNIFKDEHLYNLLDTPHDIVIYQNSVMKNGSSGIYSDGAYEIYVVENRIIQNDKEGMCLDYGTFGAYVADNVIKQNGGRLRQTDDDLTADFVLGHGRLSDGSSPAKLPGVSIDNSAYNTVMNNDITHNYGSGVKMVRSAYRNLIMQNTIADNNAGESETFHFFGIEVGHAKTPDEPVKGLDFTASYENIICRNTVTGSHYSGVFFAEESYCNDLFDNIIMDSEYFAIECKSNQFNSMVNNNTDGDIENHYGQ